MFRVGVNFRISPFVRIQYAEPRLTFIDPNEGRRSLVLRSGSKGAPIGSSTALVLEAGCWEDKEDARIQGERYKYALRKAFVRLCIGADFGGEFPVWFVERPSNRCGVTVFDANPRVAGATDHAYAGVVIISSPARWVKDVFLAALEQDVETSASVNLSIELFNAALLANSAEAGFMLLMMAIESGLKLGRRSEGARAHVCEMMRLTNNCAGLSPHEVSSMLGALGWLKKQSITQAGCEIAEKKLRGREYGNLQPGDFFKACYEVRSKLAHGRGINPEEMRERLSQLRTFVSDFLSAPALLDVPLTV